MKDVVDWLAFLIGLAVGASLGSLLIYILFLRETRTLIKTFAYDDAGRLIQVMKEYGV
jgi:hypothetical protein